MNGEMAKQDNKRKLPTKEEQDKMNKALDKATSLEKSSISFVKIDIAEWGALRLEIPSNVAKQFAFDIMTGILSKGTKIKNTPGGMFAKNVLARSFSFIMNSSENGKKGNEKRWGTQQGEQPNEPHLAPFPDGYTPDGTGGNPF